MKIVVGMVRGRKISGTSAAGQLVEMYVERCGRYAETSVRIFASEAELLGFAAEASGRTRPALVLMDSRGKLMSSEDIAAAVGGLEDGGVQVMVVGIGPADGWSKEALGRARMVVSLGKITLPHELAAVVTAEQIYRALTIRAGHPYHGGH